MLQLLSAFTLGLLMILDPCTLMTSVTAIGYIDKEIDNRRRVLTCGLMFVLGKLLTYVLLSIPYLAGARTQTLQHALETYGEPVMAVFLILCGVLLLLTGGHHAHDHGLSGWLRNVDERSSWLWSFMLGIFFAIAFCPHRLIYFVTMIDITLTLPSRWSWLMPVVFGCGTGLPILLIAWLVSYSAVNISVLSLHLSSFEKWFRTICALLFICAGLYLCVHIALDHHDHEHALLPLPAVHCLA